jgi:hypothetical protein
MYYATLTYADVFLCGGAAGWIAARRASACGRWLGALQQRGVGSLLILVLILLGLAWQRQLWYPYAAYTPVLYGVTGAVFAVAILWAVVNPQTMGCRVLRSAPMRTLGLLSYGIYLWHPISAYPVRVDLASFVPRTWHDVDAMALASFLQYLAFTIAGAALTYGLIERPFLAIKARVLSRGEAPQVHPRSARRLSWTLLLGGAGIVAVMIEFVIQAHFGALVQTRLSSVLPVRIDRAPLERTDVSAFYLVPGYLDHSSEVAALQHDVSRLAAGSVVLTGAGAALRVRPDTRWIWLTARDGWTIRVVNVGPWDDMRRRLGGLDAVYQGGRWVVDATPMQASNPNSRLSEGDARTPIPGFWISPGGAQYTLRRMEDSSGPFVRVEATRGSPYLVLNGALSRLDSVPVSLRGQIRAHSGGKMALSLYDVVAPDGRAKMDSAQVEASDLWTTLTVRVPEVIHADPRDNFSLGIFSVAPGDWFEVRELSLFVGTLP